MQLDSERQFEKEVFPAEMAEIRRRRESLGLPAPKAGGVPSPSHGLVGLALSGGGVRSASLSLGVLQALAQSGALSHVDYLSTVSGGGLIGSTVSSLLGSPGASPANDRFPLGFEPGKPERPAVRYLRNHNRYLAPGGLLDAVRLPAIVLRGIVDNLALLLPLLIIAVQITEVVDALVYAWGESIARALPVAAAGLFVLAAVLQPVLYRLAVPYFRSWEHRNRYELFLAGSLLGVVAILVSVPALLVVQRTIDLSWARVTSYLASHSGRVWAGAGLAVAIVALAAGAAQNTAKLSGKIALCVIGLAGQGIVFGLYLLLVLYHVDSPLLDPALGHDLSSGVVTPDLQAAFRLKGIELGADARIAPLDRPEGRSWSILDGSRTIDVVGSQSGRLRIDSLLLWDGPGEWIFLAAGLAGLLYGALFAKQNITSPYGFFRDRMSRAFLFRVDAAGEIRPADAVKLSDLNPPGSRAPYHLINTTLNLEGESHLDLAGRKADFFVFSRHHAGGPTTGYCRTEELERLDRHMDLGTAMAISGAGLAPNMGTLTVKPLVFLLALLDLRLDYWCPNPARVRDESALRRARLYGSVGPTYLLKEALGKLDARGPFVNLSDGGHLENLAIYELLRRRCKWIFAVDADEDPAMSFACLNDLLRYARIDLGIDIRIDLDPLRLRADGCTGDHLVVGTIDYGGGETGSLVFLKASMTGDEPEAVREYRARNPAFPQEPSSDQFFSESQFEAYRALGEHIAAAMLGSTQSYPWSAPRVTRAAAASS